MITREQFNDLRNGDVVEVRHEDHPAAVLRGPVNTSGGYVSVGPFSIAIPVEDNWSLTVIERGPRPLYVNHDRAEPVPGDVVRDADSSNERHAWVKNVDGFSNEWLAIPGHVYVPRSQLPERLRLLVDGTTGQVAP